MLDEAEYASDTDESDEDYKPGGEDSDVVSEAESEGEVENDDDNKTESNRRSKKRPAAITSPAKVETKRSRQSQAPVSKTTEKDTLDDDGDDENEDALWASFMGNSGQATNKTETKPKQAESSKQSTSTSNGNKSKVEKEKPKLQAPVSKKPEEKKLVTEIFEFAGEKVEVQKEIAVSNINPVSSKNGKTDESSKTALPFNRPRSGGVSSSSSGGISSVLGQIGKKNKLSVLEKTKLDWTGFKRTQGIDEELQTHNKGRDGYLERQDFLQRTDLRQFELEKTMRAATRRK